MSRRDEINEVLKRVEGWPEEDRATLVRNLLATVRPWQVSPPQLSRADFVGIARGQVPPPTDEQVRAWVMAANVQAIVTANKKDFAGAPIPVLCESELLARVRLL